MLTGIEISNFKSIMQIKELPLKPLTILTGKNSSGKSNILEAIAFFGQGSRLIKKRNQSHSIKDVFRYGDTIKYPYELRDFIQYQKSIEPISLKIKFKTNDIDVTNAIKTHLFSARTKPFRKSDVKIDSIGYRIGFSTHMEFFVETIYLNCPRKVLEIFQEPNKAPQIKYPPHLKNVKLKNSISNIFSIPDYTSSEFPVEDVSFKISRLIIDYIREQTSKIYFISGERGRISSSIDISDSNNGSLLKKQKEEEDPFWIGFNGQHLIDILSKCFTKYPNKGNKIKDWAKKFQLPEINAGYVGRKRLESYFKDDVFNITLNSSLAGLGSRQILSIITQIFWSEPNDIILLEEPEIALHPEKQVLLHELFAEAISEKKQIICSTHSPFFILALSRIIKNNLLSLDDIAVYEISKGPEGSKFKELKLNNQGFIEGGIPSFMKVEQELFNDWSESLESENPKED